MGEANHRSGAPRAEEHEDEFVYALDIKQARGRGIRLQHLTPVPSAPTLAEASRQLLERVDRQAATQPRDGGPSRMARFERDELPLLLPVLRGPFDPRRPETVVADGSARVRLAGARYSVPVAWARCEVQARVGVDEVEPYLGEAGSVPAYTLTNAIEQGDTAGALAILDREQRLGPAADARERQRLVKLLGRDGTLDDLNRALAAELRAGTRDETDAALMAHLEATVADKIAIANPKWR